MKEVRLDALIFNWTAVYYFHIKNRTGHWVISNFYVALSTYFNSIQYIVNCNQATSDNYCLILLNLHELETLIPFDAEMFLMLSAFGIFRSSSEISFSLFILFSSSITRLSVISSHSKWQSLVERCLVFFFKSIVH